MKVVFAIPAGSGALQVECAKSLMQAQRILDLKAIPHELFTICNCPCISVARNTLVAMFMADKEATDLFFIDFDVGFDAVAAIKLLEREEPIVAGIYPLKQDLVGFPVEIKTEDGQLRGCDGGKLVDAIFMPAGFMRIKRQVFELLADAYPELKYEENVIKVDSGVGQEAYDFFGMGSFGRKFRTEDYAFCQRWRDIGGQLWVYPDIDFEHVGRKAYIANYHEYLLNLPGGAKSNLNLTKALDTPGFMEPRELVWLASQAKQHELIVEFGSFLGRSTRALADNTAGRVYALDDWAGLRDQEWEPAVLKQLTEDFEKNMHIGFCLHLKDHIDSGKVIPITVNHSNPELLPEEWLDGNKPDMIFIDGDHKYESIKRDLVTSQKRLRPGGLLCGHDFNWPGVKKAVEEELTDFQIAPGTSIWYSVGGINE